MLIFYITSFAILKTLPLTFRQASDLTSCLPSSEKKKNTLLAFRFAHLKNTPSLQYNILDAELSVDVRDFSSSWDSQATNMEMALSWDVVPCSLVDIYRRFRGSYCLHQHRDTNQDQILSTMCGIAPPLNHKILPKNHSFWRLNVLADIHPSYRLLFTDWTVFLC
jgi:hypothetical protein